MYCTLPSMSTFPGTVLKSRYNDKQTSHKGKQLNDRNNGELSRVVDFIHNRLSSCDSGFRGRIQYKSFNTRETLRRSYN